MKKIIHIGIWGLLLVGLFILLGFVESKHKSKTCCDFNVFIDYGDADPLITVEELKNDIIRSVDTITGKPLKHIDFRKIKEEVICNPYVLRANVFTNIEGEFNIKIKQRNPLLRVIDKTHRSYYIDGEGVIFPTNPNHPVRVTVVSGNIENPGLDKSRNILLLDSLEGNNLHKDIFRLVMAIRENDFLSAQIDQIYVNEMQEFELIPKMGRHLIIFGNNDNMQDKLNNLAAFYKQGLSVASWMDYKTINLKYRNQIVCTKR